VNLYRSDIPHGLMFHRFHKYGDEPAGHGSLTELDFEKMLNHIGVERILTPEVWLSKVKSNSLQPEDICVTFDDGLRSQFEVALPVLDKYGIKAFWFIFSSVFNGEIDKNEIYNCFSFSTFSSFDIFFEEFIKSYPVPQKIFSSKAYVLFFEDIKAKHPFLTKSEIKYRFIRNYGLDKNDFEKVLDKMITSKGINISEMAKNIWMDNKMLQVLDGADHCIGLHSYSHPSVMAGLKVAEQEKEYVKNYQHITNLIGEPIECMSHPLGSYKNETIDILKKLNLVCGFCSNMTLSEINSGVNPSNFEIAREDSANILKLL